jgi:hypothetical protein
VFGILLIKEQKKNVEDKMFIKEMKHRPSPLEKERG